MIDRPLTADEQNKIDLARKLADLHDFDGIREWLNEDRAKAGSEPGNYDELFGRAMAYAEAFGVAQHLLWRLLELIERPSAQLDGQAPLFTVGV